MKIFCKPYRNGTERRRPCCRCNAETNEYLSVKTSFQVRSGSNIAKVACCRWCQTPLTKKIEQWFKSLPDSLGVILWPAKRRNRNREAFQRIGAESLRLIGEIGVPLPTPVIQDLLRERLGMMVAEVSLRKQLYELCGTGHLEQVGNRFYVPRPGIVFKPATHDRSVPRTERAA